MTTSPLSILDIDSILDDEDRAIADVSRRFCADRVLPHVADWFAQETLPARELLKHMGSLGLLGMQLEGYGCAGLSATAYGTACLELGAADAGIRSLAGVQGSLAMYPIYRFGSPEQKDSWLPRMAAGETIGCFGLTEPDVGSDPSALRTTARRDGDEWVLNGTKMWITNGAVADIAVVWARTDEGIRGFLVPAGTPGFTASLVKNKMSMRASLTSELIFQDVRLPMDAALPDAEGLSAPLTCLNEARLGIVFGSLGAARSCLEAAAAFAHERVVFGRQLDSFQLTQARLAEMTVALGRAVLLAYHLANLKDRGRLRPEQLSMGKLNSTRTAADIARESRAILGASGITLEYPVIRHLANLESELTYEGTSEVHLLVIGRALTGQQAFR